MYPAGAAVLKQIISKILKLTTEIIVINVKGKLTLHTTMKHSGSELESGPSKKPKFFLYLTKCFKFCT